MKPLLEIRDVSLSYHTSAGETPALSHLTFDLMPGEFLAVVGPSGCGKSTLLNLICGLLSAEEGTILMNDTVPSPGDPRIGYMLQKDHLLEWRTIYQNVTLGLEIRSVERHLLVRHERRTVRRHRDREADLIVQLEIGVRRTRTGRHACRRQRRIGDRRGDAHLLVARPGAFLLRAGGENHRRDCRQCQNPFHNPIL